MVRINFGVHLPSFHYERTQWTRLTGKDMQDIIFYPPTQKTTPACRNAGHFGVQTRHIARMNAKRITPKALCVGGYASADSAEEHGGTIGFAREAP